MAESLVQKVPGEVNLAAVSDASMLSVEDGRLPPPPPAASALPSGSSDGPLYELSSLKADLPFKRGLSNFFQGKSQSFTSLSEVRCIEDLAKKESAYRKTMNSSCRRDESSCMKKKPYYYAPNYSSRTVSKKVSRFASCGGSILAWSKSSSHCGNARDSPASLQKNYIYVLIKEKEKEASKR